MVNQTVVESIVPVAQRSDEPTSVRWALAGLSLSMLLPALGTSVANVALPTLARAFNATFQQVQWVVLAYLLASTTLIVSVGRLGDIVGRRRLLLAGVLLFTGASIVCGMAPTLWLLIAARAAQGIGAAMMQALAVAFVGEAIRKEETGRAMGLLGTSSAVGTALGPSLGGVLISYFDWRGIFFINIPLGILAFVLAYRHLSVIPRREPAPESTGFDPAGTILLAATLAAYALAMTLGRGQFGALNLVLIMAALVGVGMLAGSEASAASPLIEAAVFSHPERNAGFVASALVSTVLMATLVVGPFYLSYALRLDAALVGILMSVGPFVAAVTGVPAGRMVDRFGAPKITTVGLSGIAAGSCALFATPFMFSVPGYVAPTVIITGSYALFQTANNTAVMADVRHDQRGVISGVLNLSRNLGLITGASVMGAVFALASATKDVTTASPEAIASGVRITFAVSTGLMVGALALMSAGRARAQRRCAQP